MEDRPGIYLITNRLNGKSYIGSSFTVLRRRREHFRALNGQYHPNQLLQEDFNLYGAEVFTWALIESLDQRVTGKVLGAREIHFARLIGTVLHGYNLTMAVGTRQQLPRTRLKISQRFKGRKLTSEHKAKIGAANKDRSRGVKKGPLPDSVKAKLRIKALTRTHSPETIEKLRRNSTGNKWATGKRTPAQIERMKQGSAAFWAKYRSSPEMRAAASKRNSGRESKRRKPISQYALTGELLRTFTSATEAARVTSVSIGNLSNCANGKKYTAGGYSWKYVD